MSNDQSISPPDGRAPSPAPGPGRGSVLPNDSTAPHVAERGGHAPVAPPINHHLEVDRRDVEIQRDQRPSLLSLEAILPLLNETWLKLARLFLYNPPNSSFLVSVAVFVGVVSLGLGTRLFGYLLGFLYPVYRSVVAIELARHDEVAKWLTYWVVFSTFTLAEHGLDLMLYWLPMYWICKTFFLFWCMAPIHYNGSTVIYQHFIKRITLYIEREVIQTVWLASHAPGQACGPAPDAGSTPVTYPAPGLVSSSASSSIASPVARGAPASVFRRTPAAASFPRPAPAAASSPRPPPAAPFSPQPTPVTASAPKPTLTATSPSGPTPAADPARNSRSKSVKPKKI